MGSVLSNSRSRIQRRAGRRNLARAEGGQTVSRWCSSPSRGACPGPPPPPGPSPGPVLSRPAGAPEEPHTGSFPGPRKGAGILHTPPALSSSWLCAFPGHPTGLGGPSIRFRHLRSKILGLSVLRTVLETSKIPVKSSSVAPGRAVLFHNLSTFHFLPCSSLPRRGIP